jgi:hypothetical protein
MKDETTIPDHFPFVTEESIKAAAKRRENYALKRDLQAEEDNRAIASRLERDKEKNV